MQTTTTRHLLLVAMLAAVSPLPAQPSAPPTTVKEDKRGLLAKAAVSADAATATALAAVPGARVKSAEIEEEGGKLIYSYDLTVPGKRGVTEIHVDAMTGAVIGREKESTRQEKAEEQRETTYHLARKVPIGGEGGFDYVTFDPGMNRVFLTHATHVVVYDLNGNAVGGDIPNTIGVHGVALAPDLNRGFTSNGRDSSVTIFDYTTLAVIKTLPIHAINPDAITYDALTKRIFTWNHGTHDATVIDAVKGEVVATIPGMGVPETAVVDGKGSLWVNVEDSAMVMKLDTRSLKVLQRIPIAPCDEPTGLAMDQAARVLFAVCDKVMAMVDADRGALITTVAICSGPDGAAFDPQLKLAFASCSDGTLSVVRAEGKGKFSLVKTVETQRGARTLALDPKTHSIYQMAVEYGPVPAPATPGGRPGRAPVIPGSFAMLIIAP